jgi:hypothetical protein
MVSAVGCRVVHFVVLPLFVRCDEIWAPLYPETVELGSARSQGFVNVGANRVAEINLATGRVVYEKAYNISEVEVVSLIAAPAAPIIFITLAPFDPDTRITEVYDTTEHDEGWQLIRTLSWSYTLSVLSSSSSGTTLYTTGSVNANNASVVIGYDVKSGAVVSRFTCNVTTTTSSGPTTSASPPRHPSAAQSCTTSAPWQVSRADGRSADRLVIWNEVDNALYLFSTNDGAFITSYPIPHMGYDEFYDGGSFMAVSRRGDEMALILSNGSRWRFDIRQTVVFLSIDTGRLLRNLTIPGEQSLSSLSAGHEAGEWWTVETESNRVQRWTRDATERENIRVSNYPPMDECDRVYVDAQSHIFVWSSSQPILSVYRMSTRGQLLSSYQVDTSMLFCDAEDVEATFTISPHYPPLVYINNPCNRSIHVFHAESTTAELIIPYPSTAGIIEAIAVDSAGLMWYGDNGQASNATWGQLFAIETNTTSEDYGRIVRQIKLPVHSDSPLPQPISITINATDQSVIVSVYDYVHLYDNTGQLLSSWKYGPYTDDEGNVWFMEIHQVAIDPVNAQRAFVALFPYSDSAGVGLPLLLTVDAAINGGRILSNLSVPVDGWLFLMTGVAASPTVLYVTDFNLSRLLLYYRNTTSDSTPAIANEGRVNPYMSDGQVGKVVKENEKESKPRGVRGRADIKTE